MSKAYKNLIPAGHIHLKDNVLEKDCLTGVSEKKDSWAKNLDLPKHAEYTFFAGCGYQHMKYVEGMMGALKSAGKMGMGMGRVVGISKAFSKVGIDLTSITAKVTASKDDHYTSVLISAVNVLRKLGLDIGYMHEEEPCCGSPIYYAGFEEDYAKQANRNYQKFKMFGVQKMIGLVPGCTSALKNVYPKYVEGYDLKVQHILEVIHERLKATDQKPVLKESVKLVYHDPCQLSRYLQLTKEPREILRTIQGAELLDLDEEESGRWSTCCGGGGLEASHPELAERVGERRIKELEGAGASVIVTNCPGCEMQLNKMAKTRHANLKVIDLITLLDSAL